MDIKFIGSTRGYVSIDTSKYLKTKDAASASGHSLLAQIDMTHSGIVTRNYGFYLPHQMKRGAHTFTKDYKKPILIGHNENPIQESPTVGRIIAADYIDFSYPFRAKDKRFDQLYSFKDKTNSTNMDFVHHVIETYNGKDNYHGTGTIRGTLKISDADAIEKILDERYLTVSTSFISKTAFCSICAQDFEQDGMCLHSRGKFYDKKLCVFVPGEMVYDHLGITNDPADPHAHDFKILQIDGNVTKEIKGSDDSFKEDDSETPIYICGVKDKEVFSFGQEDEHFLQIKDSFNKIMEKDMPKPLDVLLAVKDYFRVSLAAFSDNPDGPGSMEITMSKSVSEIDPMMVEELAKKMAAVLATEQPTSDAAVLNEKIDKAFKDYLGAQHKLMASGSDETDLCFVDAWTSAYKDNLPDAAFAYIEPGGKKDSSGKTTPRSLRHLPHHTSKVSSPTENKTVDKPHLRNALARVSQTKISDAAKKRAEGHLERHAKALGVGDVADKAGEFTLPIPVFKMTDKYKFEESAKIEKDGFIKTSEEVSKASSSLLPSEVSTLASMKMKYDAKDAATVALYPWLKTAISEELAKDFIQYTDSQFPLADYNGETIYNEMLNYLDASKAKAFKDIPAISFCGGSGFFPVLDKETASASLKVLARCEIKPATKDKILASIFRKIDKLGIDKNTVFDTISPPCNNSIETVEILLPQYNSVKDKLIALGHKFEDKATEKTEDKKEDRFELEMLETQVESLTEELDRVEEENKAFSDTLKDFLSDAIIKEEIKKGDCKKEEKGKRKEELLIRTVDSLKDKVKDMGTVVDPNSSIKSLDKVENPVLSPDKTEEKKENLETKKIYETFNRIKQLKGKNFADQWLRTTQKKNNLIITLD